MRKCSLPSELATLTDDQLAELDRWLDRFTYARVQDLFLETHKFPIGRMKLTRYNIRRLKARALSVGAATGQSLTAADLVAIKNGDPIPDAHLNKEFLLRRTLQMVPAVKNAYQLRELHQIATYEERRAQDDRRLQLEQEITKYKFRRADLRERELALKRQAAAARPFPKRQAAAARPYPKRQAAAARTLFQQNHAAPKDAQPRGLPPH
jgi:hypothetical protein